MSGQLVSACWRWSALDPLGVNISDTYRKTGQERGSERKWRWRDVGAWLLACAGKGLAGAISLVLKRAGEFQ